MLSLPKRRSIGGRQTFFNTVFIRTRRGSPRLPAPPARPKSYNNTPFESDVFYTSQREGGRGARVVVHRHPFLPERGAWLLGARFGLARCFGVPPPRRFAFLGVFFASFSAQRFGGSTHTFRGTKACARQGVCPLLLPGLISRLWRVVAVFPASRPSRANGTLFRLSL